MKWGWILNRRNFKQIDFSSGINFVSNENELLLSNNVAYDNEEQLDDKADCLQFG